VVVLFELELATIACFNHTRQYMTLYRCALIGTSYMYMVVRECMSWEQVKAY